jgi:N-acetylneuraminate synthase
VEEDGLMGFSIGARRVGEGRCFIVAEVGMAHDGSLSLAHAYIDAIAESGADAVKFQCHLAEAESWEDEPWRVKPKWQQDSSRYAYWNRTRFWQEQWIGLARHAAERGIEFLCSPFSVKAVQMLDPLVPAWKVASGEVTHRELLEAVARTGKPVILSTGMSTLDETAEAVECLQGPECGPHAVLQCTSLYPCPPEAVGLGMMAEFRRRYGCPVGLSDHSGTIYPGLCAVERGADIVEVHVVFDRAMGGLDASSSITTAEFRVLVDGARFIERMCQPVDKDARADALEATRLVFMGKHERMA